MFRLFFTAIQEKPMFGLTITSGGAISGLLTWIGVLTPIIGFICAVVGLIAGVVTLLIKLREWRNLNKDK